MEKARKENPKNKDEQFLLNSTETDNNDNSSNNDNNKPINTREETRHHIAVIAGFMIKRYKTIKNSITHYKALIYKRIREYYKEILLVITWFIGIRGVINRYTLCDDTIS